MRNEEIIKRMNNELELININPDEANFSLIKRIMCEVNRERCNNYWKSVALIYLATKDGYLTRKAG